MLEASLWLSCSVIARSPHADRVVLCKQLDLCMVALVLQLYTCKYSDTAQQKNYTCQGVGCIAIHTMLFSCSYGVMHVTQSVLM